MPNPVITRRLPGGQLTDWMRRILANGGALPSPNTLNAVAAFQSGLDNFGLTSKMLSANIFAPDSVIAALTPYIKVTGADPYVEATPGYNGITINGWQIQNTGGPLITSTIIPSVAYASLLNAGIVLYITQTASGAQYQGAYNSSTTDGAYIEDFSNQIFAQVGRVVLGPASVHGAGYYAVSRTGATSGNIYYASSVAPHSSVASSASNDAGVAGNINFASTIGALTTNGVTGSLAQNTMYSFYAATIGLSAADSSNLFNLVQALRTQFGGGFI